MNGKKGLSEERCNLRFPGSDLKRTSDENGTTYPQVLKNILPHWKFD